MNSMKIFILITAVGFLVIAFLLFFTSTNTKSTENTPKLIVVPSSQKVGSDANQLEVKVSTNVNKEFYFTDEKGVVLFEGKKLILTPGKKEIQPDLVFQVIYDENARWKIELESNEYFIDEALNQFEEGALYPISDEALKPSNPLILSKTQK